MNALVTILGALIVTKGFWDLLQLIVNRSGRKAEVARQAATTEIDREKSRVSTEFAEVTRLKEAAEVTAAQWKSSYDRLQADWEADTVKHEARRTELARVYAVASHCVDVFATWVARMRAAADDSTGTITVKVTGDDFLALRTTISDTRLELR